MSPKLLSQMIKHATLGLIATCTVSTIITVAYVMVKNVQRRIEIKNDEKYFHDKYEVVRNTESNTDTESVTQKTSAEEENVGGENSSHLHPTAPITVNSNTNTNISVKENTNVTKTNEVNSVAEQQSTNCETYANTHINVIYGSESGNAEGLAKGLVNTLHEYNISATLINPSSWHYLDEYLYNNPHHSPLFTPISNDEDLTLHNNLYNDNNSNDNNEQDGYISSNPLTKSKTTIKEKWIRQKQSKRLNIPIYVFVVSTTGAGEPPGNYSMLYYEMERLSQKYSASEVSVSATESTASKSIHTSPEVDDSNSVNNTVNKTSKSNVNNSESTDDVPTQKTPTLTTQKTSSTPAPFAGVRFAVFGLGDSSYQNYNRCALMTKTFLKKGGGSEVCRIGFGDALKRNEEEVFDGWQHDFITTLRSKYLFSQTNQIKQLIPRPQMRLRFFPTSRPSPLAFPEPASRAWPSAQKPILISLMSREQVSVARDDEDGSAIYHLTFDIHAAQCVYQGGDHFGIYATNPQNVVDRCAALFELSEDVLNMPVELSRVAFCSIQEESTASLASTSDITQNVYINGNKDVERNNDNYESNVNRNKVSKTGTNNLITNIPPVRNKRQNAEDDDEEDNVLPARVTLREVLTRYVDLCGKPKKAVLETLLKYCTNKEEHKVFAPLIAKSSQSACEGESSTLMSISKTNQEEGKDVKPHEVSNSKQFHTILDYLEHFPSCRGISLGHFLEIMPRIQPRYYSIASDSMSSPDCIEIYVQEKMDGLASPFLCRRLAVKSNLPAKAETNISHQHIYNSSIQDRASSLNSVNNNKFSTNYDSEVYAFVRISKFHHPMRLTKQPLIMIAAGTGVAGLIGMCLRRENLMSKELLQYNKQRKNALSSDYNLYNQNSRKDVPRSNQCFDDDDDDDNDDNKMCRSITRQAAVDANTIVNSCTGPCVLFFGIRSKVKEYFVKDKLEKWAECASSTKADDNNDYQNKNMHFNNTSCSLKKEEKERGVPVITLLDCAFSRDQPDKIYVTHLIAKHGDYLSNLLCPEDANDNNNENNNNKAILYVSGDKTHMAKDVDRALINLLQEKKSLSKINAINVLQKMESDHRYLKDVY